MGNLNLIVAMDKNGLIGKDGDLPWNIPEDLKYFKETTMNQVIVMGRNTHDSLPKVLKDRIAIVISADPEYKHKWGTRVWSINQAMPWIRAYNSEFYNREVFIIGGAQIYRQFYPLVDKLYITYVNDKYEGDTYFPIKFSQINEDFEIESRRISKDSNCEFIVMKRVMK